MRTAGLWLLAAAAAFAQAPPPTAALVRGVLLERDSQAAAGEFSVRLPSNEVLRYRFDGKTYVERDKDLIDVPRLRPGEKVEVLSDAIPGSQLRYARTVHVLEDPPVPRIRGTMSTYGRRRPTSSYRSLSEFDQPTGNLTFSGVVLHITGDRMVLHTRHGEQALLLGKDTRFLHDGELVDAGALPRNTRVFVRAGKDLYDQIQAYQVVWGKILDPQ
jgi:hypothetical protein